MKWRMTYLNLLAHSLISFRFCQGRWWIDRSSSCKICGQRPKSLRNLFFNCGQLYFIRNIF